MLTGVLAALGGLVLGTGLAWLILSGVLAMTFRRTRAMIRRIIERRREVRGGRERRASDRRKT